MRNLQDTRCDSRTASGDKLFDARAQCVADVKGKPFDARAGKPFDARAQYIAPLLLLLLTGCGVTRYVPVETVRVEYRDNVREVERVDSVTDTRFVYVKGDTVIDYRDRVRWRDRNVRDSIYIERSDTIREPYPVERRLSRWEQAKMDFGGMAMGGLLVAICVAVVWLIRRFKR